MCTYLRYFRLGCGFLANQKYKKLLQPTKDHIMNITLKSSRQDIENVIVHVAIKPQ